MQHDDLPLAEMPHVNYTEAYNRTYGTDAYAVHAAKREMLVLWVESVPRANGGVTRKVTIESFTLSSDARPGTDGYAAVAYGPDSDVWSGAKARRVIGAADADRSLFTEVSLF